MALLLLSAISLANGQVEGEPSQLLALEKLVRIEMMMDIHRQEFQMLRTRTEQCAAAAAQTCNNHTAGKHSGFIIEFIQIFFYIYNFIVQENGHALQH